MSITIIALGLVLLVAFAFLAFRASSSSISTGSSNRSPQGRNAAPRKPSNPGSGSAAGAVAQGQNWLVGIGGEVEGKTYFIGQRMCTIGRTPQNAIQITDAAASRTHCQIRPMGAVLQVTDMKSRNATYVNGVRIKGTGRLNAGDELQIGEARFVFKVDVQGGSDAVLDKKAANSGVLRATVARDVKEKEPLLQDLVVRALREANGNVDEAAAKLGISPETLQKVIADTKKDIS